MAQPYPSPSTYPHQLGHDCPVVIHDSLLVYHEVGDDAGAVALHVVHHINHMTGGLQGRAMGCPSQGTNTYEQLTARL